FVLRSVHLRDGHPNRSINRANRSGITPGCNFPLGFHVDPHPSFLCCGLRTLDVVWIDLCGVEHSEHVTIAPDASLPIELQMMRVVRSVHTDKLIRFRVVIAELHSMAA